MTILILIGRDFVRFGDRTSDFAWTGKALGGLAHAVCREGLADEGKNHS